MQVFANYHYFFGLYPVVIDGVQQEFIYYLETVEY